MLSSVALVSMDDVAPAAEVIGDRTLRSLDAIHLATAHELRTELTAFLCYDQRLCACARAMPRVAMATTANTDVQILDIVRSWMLDILALGKFIALGSDPARGQKERVACRSKR